MDFLKDFIKHVKKGNTIQTDINNLFKTNLNNFSNHVKNGNTIQTDINNILKIRF
jgi:hypothetical protein